MMVATTTPCDAPRPMEKAAPTSAPIERDAHPVDAVGQHGDGERAEQRGGAGDGDDEQDAGVGEPERVADVRGEHVEGALGGLVQQLDPEEHPEGEQGDAAAEIGDAVREPHGASAGSTGPRARHGRRLAPGQRVDGPVPQVEAQAGQTPWEEDEDDEHAQAGGEELPARGEEGGAALDQRGAEDRTEGRAEPADGRRGEHDQADGHEERRLLVLLVHHEEEAAGQPGDEAGERERGQLRPQDAHAVSRRGLLVGGQRAQDAAGPAVPQALHGDQHEHQDAEAELEHGGLRGERETEQVGDAELALGDPRELGADQEVARGGEGEGERGDGGEHAVEAQCREAHHDGDGRGDGAGQEQGEAQVPVPVEERHRPDGRPDGGEGHLAQADLARPPGQHDDGAADDGEHDEHRGADELARAHPQRQRAGGAEGDQRRWRTSRP